MVFLRVHSGDVLVPVALADDSWELGDKQPSLFMWCISDYSQTASVTFSQGGRLVSGTIHITY